MRKPKHISPSSLSKFLESKDIYYLEYLSDSRPPRDPQTKAMAVGSAFDAYIKSYLHRNIFGEGHDPKFGFEALFEAQVEPHNRDEARIAGMWCFEWYQRLGAIADLMLDLNKSIGAPRFEIDLRGVIQASELGGVPFNGKPDCFFTTSEGVLVVADWKVNGYYSKSAPSPMPGFIKLRTDGKSYEIHKKAVVEEHKGIAVNTAQTLDQLDEGWARQLTIYAAQTGENIGSRFVARIEQLVCKAGPMGGGKPAIRSATHSAFVNPAFQAKVFEDASKLWALINTPPEQFHYFPNLTLEESRGKCALLERQAETLYGGDLSENDKWFNESLKSKY